VPFDEPAADAYRAIVEAAGYSRRKLLDRMIAATAIVHRAVLVTRNADDFQDIPGLRLEAWQRLGVQAKQGLGADYPRQRL
jgi:predicted nucleic acid-binding protein